ncbi:MAG: hypothetical protein ABEJ42_06690 [Halobacteriaceae archaeon]
MAPDGDLSSEVAGRLAAHRDRRAATTGTLVPGDEEVYVGDEVALRGRDLPPETALGLVWHSVEGSWGVLQGNEVTGPQYQAREERLRTVSTDGDGTVDVAVEVPQDYGGSHVVTLETPEGETVARTELEVVPWFELAERSAPLGDVFTIRGYGIGPNPLTNNYQIAWDNGMVGFVTGVMNRGTATAEVRAVGPPGEHVLQVWRNYRGVPFLQNNTQSPYGPVAGGRTSSWTVTVTEPDSDPAQCWTDPQFDETPLAVHYPELDEDTDATLAVTPTSGQPGTQAFIRGEGFPPGETVDLVWHRHQGHRVKGIPITPEPRPDVLPTVTADDDGDFQVEVEIPSDVGSTRPITASVDGRSVAVTGFMLQPEARSIEPTSGPVGTEIDIELSGVGWTIYENAPYFVYDNRPLGYVCGVDDDEANGITHVKLRAAGEPGWHFVDVYPSIFETHDDEPDFEITPHLSYIDNHPMRPLPAFHFAFEVTE